MEPAAKQGLILGAIVGIFLAAAFVYITSNWWCLLLIPVCAVMGMGPQLLKPNDPDE